MESPYPNLQFSIDKGFDQWTCREFLTYDPKNIFSNSILRDHPKLDKFKEVPESERGKAFNRYVDQYYEGNLKELKGVSKNSEVDWQKIKMRFFNLIDSLFVTKNPTESKYIYTWPEGKYTCAISIFNCNPRFIEDKNFQAYFRHPGGITYICVHEMLHFALYDYVEKSHNKLFENLGKDEMWKLSEIFNDVILRTLDFVKITTVQRPGIYAQSEEELKKYSKMWEGSKNIDEFLDKYIG